MIERELRALAASIDVPDGRDLEPAVRARLRGRPGRRRALVAVLAALFLAVAVAFAVPPARSAILRFFHLRGVSIQVVETLPTVTPPQALDIGTKIDPGDAARTAGFRPLRSQLLGRPDEVTWDGALLWYRYGHVRVLVAQFLARPRSDLLKKIADPSTRITPVTVDGEPGFFISGARHLLYEAPNHEFHDVRVRLAEDVLVWQHGPLTIRLEGRMTLAEALAVAHSFR